MMSCARSLRLSLVMVVSCAVAACSRPTYPKERLTESLQEMLSSEQLHTEVRSLDHTLAVHLDYPNTLIPQGNDITLGPAFDEASRKVIQSIHRVAFSTDAQIQFYVVLLSDPAVPGAYLTMVRYLDDVRRAQANMLDIPEMFARTVLNLDVVEAKPLTIEQYVPRDIRLEEFLSWQLARRIQHRLMEALQVSDSADVGRCGGEFRNGEFLFTLNVIPKDNRVLDAQTVQQIFQTSTSEIAKVLSSYRFSTFDTIRLVLPATGSNIVLPKTSLETFR